jgi:hypothetical protein
MASPSLSMATLQRIKHVTVAILPSCLGFFLKTHNRRADDSQVNSSSTGDASTAHTQPVHVTVLSSKGIAGNANAESTSQENRSNMHTMEAASETAPQEQQVCHECNLERPLPPKMRSAVTPKEGRYLLDGITSARKLTTTGGRFRILPMPRKSHSQHAGR